MGKAKCLKGSVTPLAAKRRKGIGIEEDSVKMGGPRHFRCWQVRANKRGWAIEGALCQEPFGRWERVGPRQSWWGSFGSDTSSHVTGGKERPHTGRKLHSFPSGGSVSMTWDRAVCWEWGGSSPFPQGVSGPLGWTGLVITFIVTTKCSLLNPVSL